MREKNILEGIDWEVEKDPVGLSRVTTEQENLHC